MALMRLAIPYEVIVRLLTAFVSAIFKSFSGLSRMKLSFCAKRMIDLTFTYACFTMDSRKFGGQIVEQHLDLKHSHF